jgi:hypothetical protein
MKDSYWQLILQAIKDNTLPTSIKILFIIAGIYFICPVDLLSGSPIDDIVVILGAFLLGGSILSNKNVTNQNSAKSDDDEVIDI